MKEETDMKAMYIKPELEITITLTEGHLCGDSNGLRQADWGANGVSDYSNEAWDNEGWTQTENPFIPIGGDDNGELNSTGNQYNLWEDEV